jgi:hypothetical protein
VRKTTREDIIAKLQRIASKGGTIAELQACKELLRLPEFAPEPDSGSGDPFERLDAGDELAPRRENRAQAS